MSDHAYYNEIDDYAAEWLENLIRAGHIAPGVVDRRSIVDVRPADLAEFTQCHFFAGVGVWSLALRQAGWRDDQRIWTGSCPCQPFSAAGKGAGFDDERHLWPAWHYLIGECRPPVIVGEQVASKDALEWWDLVQADLEAEGYAFGAFDLCAAGVGAPHIRQRLYFVGHADGQRQTAQRGFQSWAQSELGRGRDAGLVADGGGARLEGCDARAMGRERAAVERGGEVGVLGHADHRSEHALLRAQQDGPDEDLWASAASRLDGHVAGGHESEFAGVLSGFWANAEWIPCRDGKWRPVEPGTFPLAHGAPARVGRLRAYGNAIVAPLAAEWIRVVLECRP